ncbi:MAG: zinc ribbon domain-containing protein [Blastocatellia bacterium]|nr:zinc ribbon domain-containing protein [Blastocatellia bacterium]
MFCSSCGVELIKESIYCKQCGAKLLSPIKVESQLHKLPDVIRFLSLTTGVVTLGGFSLILFLVHILLKHGVGGAAVDAEFFMTLVVLLTFSISGLLIRQLSRAIGAYLGSDDSEKLNKAVLNEQVTLDKPLNTSSSITEHTTRNLIDS